METEDAATVFDTSQRPYFWNHFEDIEVEHEYRKRKNWTHRRLMRYGLLCLFFFLMAAMASSRSPHRMEEVLGPALVTICIGLLFTRVTFFSWVFPTALCAVPVTFQILSGTIRSMLGSTCDLFPVSVTVSFGLLVLTSHICPFELFLLSVLQLATSLGVNLAYCPADSVLLEHVIVLITTQVVLNFLAGLLDQEERRSYRLEMELHNSLSRQLAVQKTCKENLRRPWPEEVVQRVVLHPAERAFDFHSLVCVCVVDFKSLDVWRNKLSPVQLLKMLRKLHTALDTHATALGCEPFFRQPMEYCCMTGLKGTRNIMASLSAFASSACSIAAIVASEFGTTCEASVGLAAGWALIGLIGTRSVTYAMWGHSYSEARDCAHSGLAGAVEVSASWASVAKEHHDTPVADSADLPVLKVHLVEEVNGIVSSNTASSSQTQVSVAHEPPQPASPPPVLEPKQLFTDVGTEDAAENEESPITTEVEDPNAPKVLSRSLLTAHRESLPAMDDPENKAPSTPFWGKWLFSRLRSEGGSRSSLVASMDPLGLVGYARDMVEGISPSSARSPSPHRAFSFTSGRESGASDLWSEVALADSSRRTSVDFTQSLASLSCHERLVTFQIVPGQSGIMAKVSVIIPAVMLETHPRCKPSYNGGHVSLPMVQEEQFRIAQALPLPWLTCGLGLLLLVPNCGVIFLGSADNGLRFLPFFCSILHMTALVVPAIPFCKSHRVLGVILYAIASHCLMMLPVIGLFAPSTRRLAMAPACLLVVDFIFNIHLLHPMCRLPHVLVAQLLHAVGFGVAQLLVAHIYMPVIYNHKAAEGLPLDNGMPDMASFAVVLVPAVLFMGILWECASAFRRRTLFVTNVSNYRAKEAADKGSSYLSSLLNPHGRVLGTRPYQSNSENICDACATCTVVAVWLPSCAILETMEMEDHEPGQGWLRSVEVKLFKMLKFHETLDETLDDPDAPLVAAYSIGDIYVAHTPLDGRSVSVTAVLDLVFQWLQTGRLYGKCHIAVATGPMVGGFFGPVGRQSYSVVGDAHQRAVRCVSEMESEILIDETSRDALDQAVYNPIPSGDVPGMFGLMQQRGLRTSGLNAAYATSMETLMEEQSGAEEGGSIVQDVPQGTISRLLMRARRGR